MIRKSSHTVECPMQGKPCSHSCLAGSTYCFLVHPFSLQQPSFGFWQ